MIVISGGQTGADRAALDAAIELGLPYGGWCPAGGWAEDLPEPPGLLARYPLLRPTASRNPAVRTRLNLLESDATLILRPARMASPSRGTELTARLAREHRRPLLVVDPAGDDAVERAGDWLAGLGALERLNVAGPRESSAPGLYASAYRVLLALAERGLAR